MTQLWDENNRVVPVTRVQAGPCTIVQVKTKAKDGYSALQLAYGKRQAKNIAKPQRTIFSKLQLSPSHVREFRLEETDQYQAGDVISIDTFAVGDKVAVTGTSKGKGFQGVVKRHGFSGFRATHGNKDQERMPGAIGDKGSARVFKGKKMPGRMGGDRVTVSNLEIVKIDSENNVFYISGALPGAYNSLVLIKAEGELLVNQVVKEEVKAETKDEVKEETKEPKAEEKAEVEKKEEKVVEAEKKDEEKEVEADKKEEEKSEKKEAEKVEVEKKEEVKVEADKKQEEGKKAEVKDDAKAETEAKAEDK